MPLTAGTRLGPYEIVAPLGAGGMGEVYRAHDSRLGRSVAIKVLPPHLSVSPEVRARFEREARTISSLNHPHICVLHDIGREQDTDYLVMELVEGETLTQRLTRGPLPTSEVLKLGAQIADALDRAHRAGVVHRDLKPANIMLTRSGAKLLDFGLARATGLAGAPGGSAAAPTGLSNSPTVAQALTAEGTLVGTFQYMSPEQLEGREADSRADLWALGCVLYEMATGRRAFDGATQASLISSIMRDSPRAMSDLAPMSQTALERLVLQCLAKDPDDRWQSAGDIRRELEWIASGSSQSGAPAVAPGRRRPRGGLPGVVVGAAIAAAALLFAFGPWSARVAKMPLMRFDLDSPPGTVFDSPAEAELSPDGRLLVFTASDSSGTSRLYLRPLAARDARAVPGTEGGSLPFWSPDSRLLGFFAGGKLRKVALDGSAPVALCDAPDGRGGAWSPGGEIVFAPGNQGPLWRVSAAGGAPTALTQLDKKRGERGHRYPEFLPDGRHLLYVAIGDGEEVSTYAISLAGGKRVEVARAGSDARYVEPGWLMFLDSGVNSPQRRLLARRFDAAGSRASGDAELVLDRVDATNFGYTNVTTSGRGTLVVQHWEVPHARLAWRDRRGAMLGVALDDFVGVGPALSPDGRRLAFDNVDPQDLFVRDLSGGAATRLTFNGHAVSNIAWSRDGRTLAYSRLSQAHGWEVYTKPAEGGGPDSILFHGPGLLNYANDWSRDGRWLIVQCYDSTGQADLWKVPMQGGGRPEAYQRTPEVESGASLSPDGRWLAYTVREGSQRSVFVQSFPDPGTKYQVSGDGVAGVVWSDRGDALLALTEQGEVISIGVTTAGGFRQGATTRLFKLGKDEFLAGVVAGEQRFLVGTLKDASASTRLEVVLGWPRLLEQAK
jgi:serine/threonine protein kinase/Tol biopolymer transport system component